MLRPSDASYDEIRQIHNGLIDKRPSLIARCRTTTDVAAAVDLGRSEDLEISVRGEDITSPAPPSPTAG